MAEEKDILEEKDTEEENDETKHDSYYDRYVPWGIFSFDDLDAFREARDKSEEFKQASRDLTQIIGNIMSSDEFADKGKAVTDAANEFSQRIKEVNAKAQDEESLVKGLAKRFFEKLSGNNTEEKKEVTAPPMELVVFKDSETGEYRWVSAYSNNFRDEDNPPEIISGDSHRNFVKMVDDGEADLPELWLWHEKSLKVGDATWVGVDELEGGVTVALAAGHFDKDKQWVAELLIEEGVEGVSHGMPTDRIVRDETDKSIITGHVTREISALPRSRAANKLAGFYVNKENDMSITEEKRQQLKTALNLDADAISAIEESNKARAQKGKDAALETKDGEDGEAEEPAADKTAAPDGDAAAKESTDVVALLKEIVEDATEKALEAKVFAPVAKALKTVVDRLEALEAKDSVKIQKQIEETPSASFNAFLGSIINNKDATAEIKEDDPLAQRKPEEAPATKEGSHSDFVTNLWENG